MCCVYIYIIYCTCYLFLLPKIWSSPKIGTSSRANADSIPGIALQDAGDTEPMATPCSFTTLKPLRIVLG